MSSQILPIKDSLRLYCPHCIDIKNRSKTFHSFHALKFHLTSNHDDIIHSEYNLENIIQGLEDAKKIGLVRF